MKESIFGMHLFLSAMVIMAILFSFYKYFFVKDYLFFVEAPCDSATHQCYVRDCEEDECPPNELSSYRVFALSASRFGECDDNSCVNLCLSEPGTCAEFMCTDDPENTCEGPEEIAP